MKSERTFFRETTMFEWDVEPSIEKVDKSNPSNFERRVGASPRRQSWSFSLTWIAVTASLLGGLLGMFELIHLLHLVHA